MAGTRASPTCRSGEEESLIVYIHVHMYICDKATHHLRQSEKKQQLSCNGYKETGNSQTYYPYRHPSTSLIEVLRLTSRPGSRPFLRLWGASATELSKLALQSKSFVLLSLG